MTDFESELSDKFYSARSEASAVYTDKRAFNAGARWGYEQCRWDFPEHDSYMNESTTARQTIYDQKAEIERLNAELKLWKDHRNIRVLRERIATTEALLSRMSDALNEIHVKLTPKIPRMDGKDSWSIQQRFIDEIAKPVLEEYHNSAFAEGK